MLKSPFRHQLPALSPIPVTATAVAAGQAARLRSDPRPRLRAWLASEYQADDVLLTGSGTQALQLAIRLALAETGGRVVALPAYTCFDVATAAVGADARIVLYDLDPATLSPDPDSLERAFKAGARVVVVSPLYGVPVDWDEVERRSAAHGALAIEDAAQGHGAAWRGRRLGTLGKLSVLSFGRGKGWTGGGGGALLLRSELGTSLGAVHLPEIGARTEWLGLTKAAAQQVLGRPWLYGLPAHMPWLGLGETRYRDPEPPHAISRTAAAMVEATRQASTREAAVRRVNTARLRVGILTNSPARPVTIHPHATPGYLRLPLRVAGGRSGLPDAVAAARAGIADGYPAPLDRLPAVRARLMKSSATCPGAEALCRELITLPTHSLLTAGDMEQLLHTLYK